MKRDIDEICARVHAELPDVEIWQLNQRHPGDDNGLWWFRLPNLKNDTQIESSSGQCPFIVEHDDMKSTSDAETASAIDEAVAKVVVYLTRSRADPNSEKGNARQCWPMRRYDFRACGAAG